MDNQAPPLSSDGTRRRRRHHDAQLHDLPSPQVELTQPRPSIHSARARSFATPSTSHLQRHRLRRQREDDEAFDTVQDAVNRLNEVTSNLTTVLDEPLPQILGPDEFTGLIEDMDGYNRRSKRRKLDSDPLDPHPSFSYGHHGQVAPGRLKMLISSYDGGQITESDELVSLRSYPAENLLRNDKSVYSCKKDKCSLILKHWGETPFTITKIIIKAPESGFPAAVQEGMVFMSMSQEQLIRRASHYQIQDICPHLSPQHVSRRARAPASDNTRHSLNSMYFSQRTRLPSARFPPPPPEFSGTTYLYPQVSGAESPDTDSTPPPDISYPLGYMGSYLDLSAQQPQSSAAAGYRIETSCDEPSGDEEEPSSPAILLDRQRRVQMEESSTSDDDEDPRPRGPRHQRQRCIPRKIDWIEKGLDAETGKPSQEFIPYAKFFIERRKHVVSMKFDPPISARYLLLKLWSPPSQSRVDIQSISVHGFAGPRFLPSVQVA